MQILNGLKQPGNALARGFCGLLFGYLIGVNIFGGLMDYYFSAIGADRPNILRTFAVVTAFLCGYGCWWYRWRKSPLVGRGKGSQFWRRGLEIFAASCAGVVIGYVIGLAVSGFVVQLVEDKYFPRESHAVAAFAIGTALLFASLGWRK